uniref:Putative secreted protein n=1 Tax=Ixodes ricinus TaxID=34613 RepID=A0A6B0UC68_IXORI
MHFIPVLYKFSGLALSCIRFAYCFTCYYLTALLVLHRRVERSYDLREENCALSLAKCKPMHRLERNIYSLGRTVRGGKWHAREKPWWKGGHSSPLKFSYIPPSHCLS